MIKLLLVDDHQLFRSGVRSILETDSDIEVAGEVESGELAIEFVKNSSPDLILMDVNMPGIGGIEATRKIIRLNPEIKIIAVTALSEDPFPNQLLDAGVHGYLTKGCQAEELFEAIKSVAAGNHYISKEVAQQLALSNFVGQSRSSPLSVLTAREMQIMMMITEGQSTKEICNTLFLSPKTISTYRAHLKEKLDVSNDVELTHMAIRYGLVDQR